MDKIVWIFQKFFNILKLYTNKISKFIHYFSLVCVAVTEMKTKKVNSPLDNLQSSLAVKTPEAEMVSLQMTSLKGFRGYPTKSRNEFLALNVGIFEARMGGNSLVGTCGKTPCQMGQPWETSPSSLSLIHWQEQIQRSI